MRFPSGRLNPVDVDLLKVADRDLGCHGCVDLGDDVVDLRLVDEGKPHNFIEGPLILPKSLVHKVDLMLALLVQRRFRMTVCWQRWRECLVWLFNSTAVTSLIKALIHYGLISLGVSLRHNQ